VSLSNSSGRTGFVKECLTQDVNLTPQKLRLIRETGAGCLFAWFSKVGEIREWVLGMAHAPFFSSSEIAPIKKMGYTGFLLSPIISIAPLP
jgi:hypothetical protein